MESTVLISEAKSPQTTTPSRPAGRNWVTRVMYTVSGSSSGASARMPGHRNPRDDDDEHHDVLENPSDQEPPPGRPAGSSPPGPRCRITWFAPQ